MAKTETVVVLRFSTVEEVAVIEKALTWINVNRLNPQEQETRDHILEVLKKVKQNLARTEDNEARPKA